MPPKTSTEQPQLTTST